MIGENHVFNPTDLQLSRSTFGQSPTVSGTMNAGRLIPFKVFWVQPGDSISMEMPSLIKMSTPVYPTMDALFLDNFFFFVPFRYILGRRYGSPTLNDGNQSWAAIVGAQDNLLNMPIPANGLKVPTFDTAATAYQPGCLLDYFDMDYTAQNNEKLSALPLLAYFAIWNENFRDPNLMTPVTWSFGSNNEISPAGFVPLYATKQELQSANRTGASSLTGDYYKVNALSDDCTTSGVADDSANYWLPFPVCRFHGYFGSCLPWPQRNATGVTLPLGTSAPLVFPNSSNGYLDVLVENNSGLLLTTSDSYFVSPSQGIYQGSRGSVRAVNSSDSSGVGPLLVNVGAISSGGSYADLSSATAANVNALRAAIQQQRWYEKLARSGNRYDELEYGLFGVRPHDSGDDRPQYLGGQRIPLSIEMVASTNGGTSPSSGGSPNVGSLGTLGAFSHTRTDPLHYFYHSFDDWGVVIHVGCIRHHDTFGEGTNRFWKKLDRDSLYFPTFAHLGEQATGLDEIADVGVSTTSVFGYNPAWQEYRADFDRVHGLLRPGQSLSFMTYARSFGSGVTLADFLNASSQVASIDNTLQVKSNAAGFQFVYQFTYDYKIRRAMPTDSIPGLMDHF